MMTRNNTSKAIVLIALLMLPVWLQAQQNYRIKSHEITLDGTSNLQSWSAVAEKATGTFSITVEGGRITDVKEAELRIDARAIKGSEGRRMDVKIYEALNVDRNPNISFQLREVLSISPNPGRMETRGVLTVAGISKLIPLQATGRVLPNGDIEITGKQVIKMTDHRISPPTALLGALRTGDDVTVNYKVILTR